MIYVWKIAGQWYWDDAEDHGGFDRNVPCGPFISRLEAVKNAQKIFGDGMETFFGGPPMRYYDS